MQIAWISAVCMLLVCGAQTVRSEPRLASNGPAAGKMIALVANARGAQRYVCTVDKDKPRWVAEGPDADLFDASGEFIGHHYRDLTWEALDGSRVTGATTAQEVLEHDVTPWTLAAAHQTKRPGVFADVSSIQRTDTRGGDPPAEACDAAKRNAVRSVPYTAVYWFYRGNSG